MKQVRFNEKYCEKSDDISFYTIVERVQLWKRVDIYLVLVFQK